MTRRSFGCVVLFTLLVGCPSSSAPPTALAAWSLTVETHSIAPAPGVKIGLVRYRPLGAPALPETVLLLHGYPVNHHEFDADEPFSMARRIAEAGFETWAIDFRGAELSPTTDWRFNLDDLAHTDLPAAIAYALAVSQRSSFFLLGHSLGGSVLEAYLATHPEAPCRGAVFIAPAIFVPYPGWQTDPLRMAFWKTLSLSHGTIPPHLPVPAGGLVDGVTGTLPASTVELTVKILNWFMGPLIWASDNTNSEIAQMGLQQMVSNSNSTLMRQMLTWAYYLHNFTYGPSPWEWHWESSAYYQSKGFTNYTDLLPTITVPQLWMNGPKDNLVPLEMAKHAFSMSGGTDKTFVVASKASGFAVDYGHADTVIGLHSPKDVYPRVVQWLTSRSR